MEEVVHNIEQLDLFSLIFDNQELGNKTIESSLILLKILEKEKEFILNN